jgi:hypothetical protein
VFDTRLGLSFLDALTGPHRQTARTVTVGQIHRATTDGYAARDVLHHPGCRRIATHEQTHALTTLVDACGLDSACLAPAMLADLNTALDTAEPVIAQASAHHVRTAAAKPPTTARYRAAPQHHRRP